MHPRRLNVKFTDRMKRIKVPLPPTDEKKKVIEDVDKDRRYAIDAAIVRTMKSRKVCVCLLFWGYVCVCCSGVGLGWVGWV